MNIKIEAKNLCSRSDDQELLQPYLRINPLVKIYKCLVHNPKRKNSPKGGLPR
jgi:hypothetical protein